MRRSSSINPHVRMFAIALATIVAAFTLVSPAKAEIVYHSANIGINLGTYNLDLNGDGVTDFTITSAWSGRCAFGSDASFELTETPASGNGAVLGPLKLGNEIGPNQSFDGNEGVMSGYRLVFSIRLHKCVIEILDWPWLGKTGYLGLSLQVNGQTYYGWALLHSPKPGGSGTFLGYAYETIAGRAILAGETSYVWFTPASLNFGTVTLGDWGPQQLGLFQQERKSALRRQRCSRRYLYADVYLHAETCRKGESCLLCL